MNTIHNKDIGTKQKALAINLNTEIYGSFAEIGAGQDVAPIFSKQVLPRALLPKPCRLMT